MTVLVGRVFLFLWLTEVFGRNKIVVYLGGFKRQSYSCFRGKHIGNKGSGYRSLPVDKDII